MNGRSVGMSRELVPLGVVSESNYLYYSSIYYVIRCVCLLNVISGDNIQSKVDLSRKKFFLVN